MVYYKFFKLFSQLHAVTRRFKRKDDCTEVQCSDKCLSTPYINHVVVNEVMRHLQ